MRAIGVGVAGFTVAILIGGLTGVLIVAGMFTVGAMLMVSDVRGVGEEPREEVGAGRSAPRLPADANAGVEA